MTSFDTSKVNTIRHMFYNNSALILDLSSFIIKPNIEKYQVFNGAKAKIIYVKNEEEKEKLCVGTGIPSTMKIVVKNN